MRRLLVLFVFALGVLVPSLEAQARTHASPRATFQESPQPRSQAGVIAKARAFAQARVFAQAQAMTRIRSRASLGSSARSRSSYVSFQPQVSGLGCLQPRARAMIARLTARIGPIQITSTCGGRHANNSQHYRGNAIDFRPQRASVGAALSALRGLPEVGGVGSYPGGLIHADVGAREASWYGHGGHSRLARTGGMRARYASLTRKRR